MDIIINAMQIVSERYPLTRKQQSFDTAMKTSALRTWDSKPLSLFFVHTFSE